MLEKHGFFNGATGDPREYSSADLATAFRILSYLGGVSQLGTNLEVTAEGGTMKTLVGYGTAMLSGYWYELLDDGGDGLSFTHSTSGGLSRIDRIVFRLNLTTRTITVAKVIGVESSTPEAPALTWNSEVQEGSLAQVTIRAGATEILPSDILDERPDDVVCGVIAPASMRPANIIAYILANTADVLRYSPMTLTTSQKEQMRANIDAPYSSDVRIKSYTSLSNLGLEYSDAITLEQIFGAMPDNSVLTIHPESSATGNVSPSEDRNGILVLTRQVAFRCRAQFISRLKNNIWINYASYAETWTVGTWQRLSPSIEIAATLAAASWTGEAAPYDQTVSIAGMAVATKNVSVGLSSTATDEQYIAAAAAMLRATAQGNGNITVRAIGDKPTIDLPIIVRMEV